MEKSSRTIIQVYGYSVCLVAVITFLVSTSGLINAVIDAQDPLHSGFRSKDEPSLVSFDHYKLDVLRSGQPGGTSTTAAYAPSDEELRAMYEAARNDKLQDSAHESRKSMLINGAMIAISLALFVGHWMWMRGMSKS